MSNNSGITRDAIGPCAVQGRESLSLILDEIEERANKATPCGWQVAYWLGTINEVSHQALAIWPDDILEPFRGDPICLVSNVDTQNTQDEINATFIAAARTDVPKLVKALREVLKAIESVDVLGVTGDGVRQWPVRDELIYRLTAILNGEDAEEDLGNTPSRKN